jgi:deoxyribodipyrimidine photo-lyase
LKHPVDPRRLHVLRDGEANPGRYVLHWMQASVRADNNPALDYAIAWANDLELPLLVCFGLTDDYPEAVARHYAFLLDGLRAAAQGLRRRKIRLLVRRGAPDEIAIALARDAGAVVVDGGYLRHQRAWRSRLAEQLAVPVVEVEGDVIVPTAVVSDKREYAARTLRPKITRQLEQFCVPQRSVTLKRSGLDLEIAPDASDVALDDALLDRLDVDRSVAPVDHLFRGGTERGRAALDAFVEHRLESYDEDRNQPQKATVSHLAMYLNYGQLSPIEVALRVQDSGAAGTQIDSFLEELVVRRELAINYVRYEPDYDRYTALPEWARKTLDEHRQDPRDHLYSREELMQAETHDRYWNTAMVELRETGYMHNYMRMYWGKKILEWSESPETAFATTLYLNNRFGLDGRVAPSFVGVAWVFGLHDRAWTERPVFGKIRYMNAAGLKRKADPDGYTRRIAAATGVAIGGDGA